MSELKGLPSAIADPIAVFDNYNKDDNRSILTELRTEQGNFLVALDLGKDGDIDFNIISSVFGKGKEKVSTWLQRGIATYINNQKVKDFLSHPSAPIAAAAAKLSPSDAAKLNKIGELNKLWAKNFMSALKISRIGSEIGRKTQKMQQRQLTRMESR